MNLKKRIIIAIIVVTVIFLICFIGFKFIGLANNDVVEKGFFKKSKTIQFKSAKDYDYINFELLFSKNDIENNKIYYKILDPKENIIHKGTLNNHKNGTTGELFSKGMKGIWKIKLISKNKKINLEYKYHIKTGNYK